MENSKNLIEELKTVKTKQLENEINLEDYKGKNILTVGTYDLLHIGHNKIIDHCVEISGDESNVVISVSSDYWNGLKGKKSFQDQDERMSNINKAYPRATVILEHHDKAEESWPTMWDDHNIDLIIMEEIIMKLFHILMK